MVWHDNPIWERSGILLGDAAIERLANAHVLLAGLGGVGSFAAEALARAGIGALTIADHDRVAPSNLNRQLCALRSTVEQKKADVMAARIRDINPTCRLTVIDHFLEPDELPSLLQQGGDGGGFDQVVDAIDSLSSKVALIAAALDAGVPVAASMGAGGKLDPTRIRVGDLMDSEGSAACLRSGRRSHRARHCRPNPPAAADRAPSTAPSVICQRCSGSPWRGWSSSGWRRGRVTLVLIVVDTLYGRVWASAIEGRPWVAKPGCPRPVVTKVFSPDACLGCLPFGVRLWVNKFVPTIWGLRAPWLQAPRLISHHEP